MQPLVLNPKRPHSPSRGQRLIALLVLCTLIAGLLSRGGLAAENAKTIMLGESLSDAQRQELLDYFGKGEDDRVKTITIAYTREAMTGIIDVPDSAFSSTALTCRPLGDGLAVSTRNITVITPSMYAMALVTAGIGDAELVVAAPNSAAALGMTALAGVFLTWDVAPCDSGTTSNERQRLALEQLALTVDLGQARGPGGIKAASDLVLYTQQAVVVEGLTKSDQIDAAVRDQELKNAITLNADERARLVDFMVRLAGEDIDWSTFSAGWTIEPTADGTGISMKGDGIAIRNARLTATARAADSMTQTAGAASKQATADARATQNALSAALTATAAAMPTSTPVPVPVAVSGTISDISDGQIWVNSSGGGDAVAYQVPAEAQITRGGEASKFDALRKGDRVELTADPSSFVVSQMTVSAAPTAGGFLAGPGKFLLFLPILAAIPVIFFVKNRGGGARAGEAFIVKRVASA